MDLIFIVKIILSYHQIRRVSDLSPNLKIMVSLNTTTMPQLKFHSHFSPIDQTISIFILDRDSISGIIKLPTKYPSQQAMTEKSRLAKTDREVRGTD